MVLSPSTVCFKAVLKSSIVWRHQGNLMRTLSQTQTIWNCPECGLEVSEPRKRGPHLSGCRKKAVYIAPDIKLCTKCKQPRSVSEYSNRNDTWDKLHPWCKVCDRANATKWYREHPEQARESRRAWLQSEEGRKAHRKSVLKYRYKISPEEYEARLAKQDYKCAACGTSEPGGRGAFHIDHDHSCCPGRRSCGKCLRGLLCSACNQILGGIENRPGLLSYLKSWERA